LNFEAANTITKLVDAKIPFERAVGDISMLVVTLERCHELQDVASVRREKALFDAWLSRWDEAFDFLRR